MYEDIFTRKKETLFHLQLAQGYIDRDERWRLRAMVCTVARHYYGFNTYDWGSKEVNNTEKRREVISGSLDSVKLGEVRAVFAASGETFPPVSNMDELIGNHREEIIESVVHHISSPRAEAMFSDFVDCIKGIVEVHDFLCNFA